MKIRPLSHRGKGAFDSLAFPGVYSTTQTAPIAVSPENSER